MATTKKPEQIAALRLEEGKEAAGSFAYGGTPLALGATHAIPYLSIGIDGKSEVVQPEDVDGAAQRDLPIQTKLNAPLDSWEGNMRFRGMDRWLYWVFGYEDGASSPSQQFIFTVAVTDSPEVDDVYSNNGSQFTIREVNITSGAGTIRCERTAGVNDPTASGNLVYVSGGAAGDDPVVYSAVDKTYYNHLFELDAHERHYTEYRTAEKTAGDQHANDRKNRFAVIGIKKGTNDYRYAYALCNGFGFNSEAGDLLKWNAKGNSRKEERADYDSANWTYPTGAAGSDNIAGHHQLKVSLGPSGSLVDVAVTNISVEVDIPIQVQQDSESGLYIAEPILNGKYGVQVAITLARHEVDTYKAYRDDFTAVVMKAVYDYGHYSFGLFFPDLRIVDGPNTDEEVPKHPLTFASAKEPSGGNPFTAEVGSIDLIQSGEVFAIMRNKNTTNEMRRE